MTGDCAIMTKFITQQRRGTTEEWIENKDTIIAEGEIVVEECGDYVKFKVGNGVTTFEKLPYFTKKIDENIANALISSIRLADSKENPFLRSAITYFRFCALFN